MVVIVRAQIELEVIWFVDERISLFGQAVIYLDFKFFVKGQTGGSQHGFMGVSQEGSIPTPAGVAARTGRSHNHFYGPIRRQYVRKPLFQNA